MLFHFKKKDSNTDGSRLDSDLRQYLQKGLENSEMDPLKYWVKNANFCPELSKTVVSTSVPCERLFSRAEMLFQISVVL